MRTVNASGFTLVELLVVITIIVVLLALLVPALDRAIYQAELAVCGARLSAVATASIVYAMDNKRSFPRRHEGFVWQDVRIIKTNYVGYPFDLRAYYEDLMSIDAWVDPVAGDISLRESDNAPESWLYSGYYVYIDIKMTGPTGATYNPQRRLGHGFTSTVLYNDDQTVNSFSIIAADMDWVRNFNPGSENGWSSHPDDAGDKSLATLQSSTTKNEGQELPVVVEPLNFNQTMSFYRGGRRSLTSNYAYQDGSVRRFDAVTARDERMAQVAHSDPQQYQQGRYAQIPRAGQ
jgi:prepilin-type N-terminal cleavage/methylation domain-containing protein